MLVRWRNHCESSHGSLLRGGMEAEYSCDERVCLSVRLSVCQHAYLRNYASERNKFFLCSCVHVTNTYGSVLLSQHHDKLRTSGFVNDVVFAHNDRKWAIRKWRILKRLTWRISEPGGEV